MVGYSLCFLRREPLEKYEAFAASQIAMTESWNWSSLSSSEDRKEYILSVPASGDVTIKLMGYFTGPR